MRFDDRFLDDIRARLSVSHVVGRRVALKKSGREYRGLSPFKDEKTPSFFVNDIKGFYHCFASGEHGDIFKFVMTTEGLNFPEAVERLAQEAGIALPKPPQRRFDNPADAARYAAAETEREDARARLYRLLEVAAGFFRDQLKASAGREALAYVHRRGLRPETVETFGIGYAPGGRFALKEHLAKQGFTAADMITSGMLIGGEDITVPYDRFRNRVMFPITDLKGRVIAFGGRALDPDAPAKYLNSPETPLFHKGSILFNAHRARPLAHDRERVIVCEGYMDVVALTEAGFGDAVAPLGTALTEDQAGLLWRFVSEPTLCLDGDAAGRKAAFRAIDTVLPHLKPGRSMAFAFLPDGLDPDDLIRQRGAEAMAEVLGRARPLVDVLFEREIARGDLSTPERRARTEQALRNCVSAIADPSVRSHYDREIRDRWYKHLRADAGRSAPNRPRTSRPGERGGARDGRGFGAGARYGAVAMAASTSLRDSAMASGGPIAIPQREGLLLRAILLHPWLLDDHAEAIAELTVTSAPLCGLRDAILAVQAGEKTLDTNELRSHLTERGFASTVGAIEQLATHRRDRFAEASSDSETVLAQWLHALQLHEQVVGLQRALDAAERAWHDDQSADAFDTILDIRQRLVTFGASADVT